MVSKLSHPTIILLFILLSALISLSHQQRLQAPAWPTEQHDNLKSGFFPFPAQAVTRPQLLLYSNLQEPPAAGRSWVTSIDNQYLFSAWYRTTVWTLDDQNNTISNLAHIPPGAPTNGSQTNWIAAMDPWQSCQNRLATVINLPPPFENPGEFLYIYCFDDLNIQYISPTPFNYTTSPLSYTHSNTTFTGVVVGTYNGLYTWAEDTTGAVITNLIPGTVLGLAMDLNQNIYTINTTTVSVWSSYPTITLTQSVNIPTGLCNGINNCFLTVDHGYNILYVYCRGSTKILGLALGTLTQVFPVTSLNYQAARPGALTSWSNSTSSGKLLIIPQTNFNVSAFDPITQKIVWTYTADSNRLSNAVVDVQGIAYVADNSGTFYGLNATNGNLLWKSQPTEISAPSPKQVTISMGPSGEFIISFDFATYFVADTQVWSHDDMYYPMGFENVTVFVDFHYTGHPELEPDFSGFACQVVADGLAPVSWQASDNQTISCPISAAYANLSVINASYILWYHGGEPEVIEGPIGQLIGVEITSVSPNEISFEDVNAKITIKGQGFSACNRQHSPPCQCAFQNGTNSALFAISNATYVDNSTVTCFAPTSITGKETIYVTLWFASFTSYFISIDALKIDYVAPSKKNHTGLIVALVLVGVFVAAAVIAGLIFVWYRNKKNRRYVPLGDVENKKYTSWS